MPKKILESYSKSIENSKENVSLAFQNLLNEINSNSYAMGIHNIYENDKILFFQYKLTLDGTYTVLYNKLTKQIRSGKPENDLDYGLFGEPLALLGDTLITYIYPFKLMNRIKSMESDLLFGISNSKYIALKKLSDSMQEFENPIIAKFILKEY